ncbi:anhydro-N-acetylmuramic acid kinase AnmK [soil metagenome]
MSGTSADGLDLSLSEITGSGHQTEFELIKFATVSYSLTIKEMLKELLFDENAAQAKVLRLQAELEQEWIQQIKKQLESWNVPLDTIDLIASHGQTVLHLPSDTDKSAATWQLVDGDLLATKLGIITISDFRKKHIAAGYDGAPLAPLGERLLIRKEILPAVLLNLGGISNFTFLDNSGENALIPFSTDTGPASTLIDAAVQHYYPVLSYDESGRIAASGKTNKSLLNRLKNHQFYQKRAPKSTGPEEFKLEWVFQIKKELNPEINPEDFIATLTHFSAWGIGHEIREHIGDRELTIYVSGGGVYNNTLLKLIGEELPGCDVKSSEQIGIPPDAKEAILFSVFANELVAGEGWLLPSGKRLTMGKISFPLNL